MTEDNRFSHTVNVFHGRFLPEAGVLLAGYAALIKAYGLDIPLPEKLSAISKKHQKYQNAEWMMFTPRHAPDESLYGHLIFALKYEGIDLAVLKALFDIIDPHEIISIVKFEPTSSYSRRIWFLYEWLQDKILALPNAIKGNMVDVLNPSLQYPGPMRISKRHRVRNNLPGVRDFCPLIRKTSKLDQFIQMKLDDAARNMISAVQPDILMRAAAFLLLKDSKASFAIEGETPQQTRAERWGQAISQAGLHELSHDQFIKLQEMIIADFRFIHYGYRNEGGFIGEHERGTGLPIPDHISARSQDLIMLMNGLIETDKLLKNSEMNAVLVAAVIAFGFVFIHPFEDGNGRIHRYLIHHVLAEKKFTPENLTFPVSAVILNHIDEYRQTLEAYSRPRLKLIQWHTTGKGNVEALNDTINLYRYFDATKQAEFLFECVKLTIEKTLPEEVNYLKEYDELKEFLKNYINMPDRLTDLLIRFLNQNNGILSRRARENEFQSLTEDEVLIIQNKYKEVKDGSKNK